MQFLMQFLSEQNDFCEGYCVGPLVPWRGGHCTVGSESSESDLLGWLTAAGNWEAWALGSGLWEDLKTCDVNGVPLHSRSHTVGTYVMLALLYSYEYL